MRTNDIYTNRIFLRELEMQTPMGFWDTNGSPNISQTTDIVIIDKKKKKKKWTYRIVDFAIPAEHRVKLKESGKKDKHMNLVRKLKKLWIMKVTIILIVIGVHGTATKGLVHGLDDLEIAGWVETIQTTALLRSPRILRKVLET